MGRLGDAIDAARVTKGPTCHTAQLISTLDTDDAADLIRHLKGTQGSDEQWYGAAGSTIRDTIASELGVEVGAASLLNHRKALRGLPGGCACQAT